MRVTSQAYGFEGYIGSGVNTRTLSYSTFIDICNKHSHQLNGIDFSLRLLFNEQCGYKYGTNHIYGKG